MVKLLVLNLILMGMAQTGWAAPGDDRDLEAASVENEACLDGYCPKNNASGTRHRLSRAEAIKLADMIFDDAFKGKPLPPLPDSKAEK